MGYCIGGDGHLPHITLIQTTVSDDFNVQGLCKKVMALNWDRDNTVEFDSYYHNFEKPYNGVGILNDTTLQTLHEEALIIHRNFGLPIESSYGDDFWPHMTFAKSVYRLTEPVQLPHELQGKTSGWRLEFGYRGNHGVYLGPFNP